MMNISKDKFKEIPKIDLPDIGLGVMRTSGTYIAALLQMEDKDSRIRILIDVSKKLGITLNELIGIYNDKACTNCGISLYNHKDNNGECF